MKLMACVGWWALFTAGPVAADMLGIAAGVEYSRLQPSVIAGDAGAAGSWVFREASSLAWSVRFEHPVPLLPNIAARYQQIDYSAQGPLPNSLQLGKTIFGAEQDTRQSQKYQYYDLAAYFELLDGPVLSLDLGLTARKLALKSTLSNALSQNSANLSVLIPMLYLDSEMGVWGSDTVLFAKGNYSQYQSDLNYDWQVGIAWRFIDIAPFQAYLRTGWQYNKLEVTNRDHQDVNSKSSTGFAGLYLDF